MRILIFFILFTFNFNSQERINVHSTIDLTVRKAPDPAKPVDWNKVSEDLSNSLNEVANSIEQKRAILENLTKESKKIGGSILSDFNR